VTPCCVYSREERLETENVSGRKIKFNIEVRNKRRYNQERTAAGAEILKAATVRVNRDLITVF
jgi:hypothetical protein